MPKVSIIIPTYNQAQYIGQAINSVQAQTFPDWELIIVDDGSTDETEAIISQFKDVRIRYLYQENQERSRARNNGIRNARGSLVAFLDADDYWLPTYLEKQAANLASDPQLGFSHTWVYYIDPQGQTIRVEGKGMSNAQSHQEFLTAMLLGCQISTPGSVMVRAECLKTIGLFDPDLKHVEDWDLWLRLTLKYPVGVVSEPLVCYRNYNVFMPARLSRLGVEQGYVRVVQKAFEQLRDTPLYALKSQALGEAYWRGAWIRYAVGDVRDGQSWMTQAYEVYPKLFAPPYQDFIESVGYRADELYDLVTPLDEALTFIDRLFSHLPSWAKSLQQLHRTVKGQYCGLHLFRSYEQRNWHNILKAAMLAIGYRPSWLTNRGFLSITMQALLATNSITRRLIRV